MQNLSNEAFSFLKSVVNYYLATCIPKLGKEFIDNLLVEKFRTIDIEKLKEEELIGLLLSLFERSKVLFGEKVSVSDLEKSVRGVASVTGITQAYVEFLHVLPIGVMENEKITSLGRADLEDMVRERTQQLEESRDILEKKVSERTLELESEKNKLRLVLANTVDGILALDRNKKIVSFNKSMEKITGLLETEAIGKDVDDLIKIFDLDNKAVMCSTYCSAFRYSASEIGVYKADNLVLVGKNNKQFNISLVSNNIEDLKSNIKCIVTFHDITKEKELDTMKFDFVSIAAHELRTPLTAIRGYLSLLMGEVEGKVILNTEQKSFLDKAYMSSNQLYALVENLLSVSRIERGNVKLTLEVVEWSSFVSEIVENFKDFSKNNNISISFVRPTFTSKIKADKVMVSEVVSNLIDNAIKYTNPGGSIMVFLEDSDKFVVTHIKDTGAGIGRESIPHLFTKFYRVGGVQEGSHGTGLGLYISKEIVNMHGGEIWVESELGVGSVFSFSLPKSNG